MATKTLAIEGVKPGQIMSWFVTTQAGNKITAKLYDNKKTYFCNSKQSTNITPPLAEGNAIIEGSSLQIEITSEPAQHIDTWFHNMDITSPISGECAGKCFVLAAEDGSDNDYNDICVSITTWNHKG